MMASEFQLADQYMYKGMCMSGLAFPKHITERVENSFKLLDGDVIIATYPKAGTTWFQEAVWLISNNADTKTASSVLQDIRVPFLEIDKGMVPLDIDILEQSSSPRLMKTHLPVNFFEKHFKTAKVKVILGARNVKDTLVSSYYFYMMNEAMGLFKGTFNEFFENVFKKKRMSHGDWYETNLGYWNNRENCDFFLLKYEDLKRDTEGTVRKLARYLEKDLTDEQVSTIVKYISFDSMKDNDQVNKIRHPGFNHDISPFMRKGKVGDWKDVLNKEQNEYLDNKLKEMIEGTGIEFDYEI